MDRHNATRHDERNCATAFDARVVAAGTPARVVREIGEADRVSVR